MRRRPVQLALSASLLLSAQVSASEPDRNPLAPAARALQEELARHGLELRLDQALSYQRGTETLSGQHDLGHYAWDLVADWRALEHPRWGRGCLRSEWIGSVGLDHGVQRLSANVGSASTLNALVEADGAALTELSWEQSAPDGRLGLRLGRVDPKSAFDANRVANDPYGQFLAGELENNASIPFSAYGGLGALLHWAPREGWVLRAAAAQSNADEPFAFWRTLDEDSWWLLLELDGTWRNDLLGRGQLRLTPWHHRLRGASGFGAGLSLDQELGHQRLRGFLRLGIGDEDVTPAAHFASLGVSLAAPFGRDGDALAAGLAWSDPGPGPGRRTETLFELFYRLALSPSIALTPDLQLLCPTAFRPGRGCVAVGGLRLALRL